MNKAISAYMSKIGRIGGHNGAGIPKYRAPAENARITRQGCGQVERTRQEKEGINTSGTIKRKFFRQFLFLIQNLSCNQKKEFFVLRECITPRNQKHSFL